MIDSKEVALKKANDDILFFVHRGKFDRLETKKDMYVVHSTTGSSEYPFANLKNGDACTILGKPQCNTYLAYFFKGKFYSKYNKDGEFLINGFGSEYSHVTFTAKTGFNILEHLKEQS